MDKTISAYGSAELELCSSIEAGFFSTIKYIYTAEHPVDLSGYIKIAFRAAGDFGTPQFDRPGEDNYCSVQTSGRCQIIPRWDPKGHIYPWDKALYLQVTKGCLADGDTVTVIFGDTSKGARGWQLQTFIEETFEFKTLVDPFATYEFEEIPLSPSMPIIPGEPVKAVCMAPSMVKLNEEFAFYLKVEDTWGNPSGPMDKIIHPGFPDAGINYIDLSDREFNLEAHSHPVSVVNDFPELKYYWADFHGQTEETIGTNDIEDYFYFGCYWSRLDILGHQGCDFQITDTFWQRIKETSEAYNAPGKFVSFPGYEWSGATPLGGSRNVFFADSDGEINRSSRVRLPDHASIYQDSPTAEILFETLKSQTARSFCFAHAGDRLANLDVHDEEIEVAVEIHSTRGTFEWLLEDAFKKGYRIGVCANSDSNKCQPGSSYPGASRLSSHGGLTCVLSPALNRDDIYDAMMKRHAYATTGNHCLIDVKLNVNGEPSGMMGDVVSLKTGGLPSLNIKIAGTAPVERVEIKNGSRVIYTKRLYKPAKLGSRIKIVWSGAEVKGYDREVDWSGNLQVIDNQISNITSVNFWNPDSQIHFINTTQAEWESVTAGGSAGCIIDLENPYQGKLQIETAQGVVIYDLSRDGFLPQEYKFGGLEKKISIYRLPDELSATEIDFRYNIENLFEGDNPIYIRLIQQDGHMAWSSPIYIIPE
jgi:Protein of unknown function (DUF3604)